jgi:hypothetical protein
MKSIGRIDHRSRNNAKCNQSGSTIATETYQQPIPSYYDDEQRDDAN